MITSFFCSKKQKETETKQADRQEHKTQAEHPNPEFPPEKENNTSTSAFQSGGSPPFPPRSNRLFYLLAGSLFPGLRLICRKIVFDEATDVGV